MRTLRAFARCGTCEQFLLIRCGSSRVHMQCHVLLLLRPGDTPKAVPGCVPRVFHFCSTTLESLLFQGKKGQRRSRGPANTAARKEGSDCGHIRGQIRGWHSTVAVVRVVGLSTGPCYVYCSLVSWFLCPIPAGTEAATKQTEETGGADARVEEQREHFSGLPREHRLLCVVRCVRVPWECVMRPTGICFGYGGDAKERVTDPSPAEGAAPKKVNLLLLPCQEETDV